MKRTIVFCLILLVNFGFAEDVTIYVSPNGNNENTGNSIREPLKDIQFALDKIPELKPKATGPIHIQLLPGFYYLAGPLELSPEHSGTAESPVIISAPAGKEVIIHSGKKIDGWEQQKNGLWVADIPEVASGQWNFKQLYVDGNLRQRARKPNDGFLRVKGMPEGTPKTVGYHTDCQSFEFAEGDIDPAWKNLEDVEVIVYHFWTDSHLPIQSIDTETNIVTFKHKAGKVFTDDFSEDGARYIVENVFEELDAPGEWYLDRKAGKCWYFPLPDEKIGGAACIAPVREKLIDIKGGQHSLDFVEQVHFKNIIFEYTNFLLPEGSSNDGQGAREVSASVSLKGARHCSFEYCEFRSLGNWAVEVLDGCSNISFTSNKVHHIAAGAIRINGGDEKEHPLDRTGHNKIADNEVAHYGQVYPSAVGVLLMQTFFNEVTHNHIHHGYYTGISVGWEWGYQRSISWGNQITNNHIHHIGQGLLSDMGGIYTLGVSPGTVLRNNLIHDVDANRYGGWGIYNDEGSSHILVENNIVYNTKFSGYDVNSSKGILVRNNIFALGRLHQLSRNRMEPHKSFYFENNIVYWKEGDLLDGQWKDEPYMFYFRPPGRDGSREREVTSTFDMDYNLYYNPNLKLEEVDFDGSDITGWHNRGKDIHSIYADPLFMDAENYDFRLKPGSPAFRLGFKPIDLSDVGPRMPVGIPYE